MLARIIGIDDFLFDSTRPYLVGGPDRKIINVGIIWEIMVKLEWEVVECSGVSNMNCTRARIGNGWLVQSATGSITFVIGNERTSDADW